MALGLQIIVLVATLLNTGKNHPPRTAPATRQAPSRAAAPPAAAPDKVVYRKHTVLDLTGMLIEGDLTKPSGSYIVDRKVSRFSTLVKLRENFIPELLASPDEL